MDIYDICLYLNCLLLIFIPVVWKCYFYFFFQLDPENTGFIAVENFTSLVEDHELQLDPSKLDMLLALVQSNEEGQVCYQELIELVSENQTQRHTDTHMGFFSTIDIWYSPDKWFVNKIIQNLLDRFPQNMVEGSGMGQWRTHHILVQDKSVDPEHIADFPGNKIAIKWQIWGTNINIYENVKFGAA